MNDAQQRIWGLGVASLLEPFGFEKSGTTLAKAAPIQRIHLVQHQEVPSRFCVVLQNGSGVKSDLGTLAKGRAHWWDTETHSEKAIIADITTAILEHGLAWFQG